MGEPFPAGLSLCKIRTQQGSHDRPPGSGTGFQFLARAPVRPARECLISLQSNPRRSGPCRGFVVTENPTENQCSRVQNREHSFLKSTVAVFRVPKHSPHHWIPKAGDQVGKGPSDPAFPQWSQLHSIAQRSMQPSHHIAARQPGNNVGSRVGDGLNRSEFGNNFVCQGPRDIPNSQHRTTTTLRFALRDPTPPTPA